MLPPHALTEPDGFPVFQLMPSTPQHATGAVLARIGASEIGPEFRASKPVTRCLDSRRSGQSGTLWERPAGPKHTRAEQDQKLGQLRCTRQGLVRVPESNTKYGGKGRKTGGRQHPQCRQVSVSPQGFPSEKNCFEQADFSFVPLFTGNYLLRPRGCSDETHVKLREVRTGMPVRR